MQDDRYIKQNLKIRQQMKKFKKPSKVLPELIQKDGITQIKNLSSENIQTLVRSSQLSTEQGESYFQFTNKAGVISQQVINYGKQNPNHTPQEAQDFIKNLNHELTEKNIQEFTQVHNALINNWEIHYEIIKQQETQESGIFNNVNTEEETGIVRQLTDPMNHLKELLEAAKLKKVNDVFVFEGKIQDSYGVEIILRYELNASSEEEAYELCEKYKKMMLTKGLKIWMAHWKTANQHHSLTFSCPMTEIMEAISEETRTARFAVGERQEHWTITQKLAKTELSFEKIIKRGNKDKKQWFQQPLLEILGGEKETTESYPDIVAICVLKPQFNIKFFPAIYKNNTLRLHPNDTGLAFYIQTRASQYGKGEKDITINWPLLFFHGGLEKTSQTSMRTAKARIRKKIKELQDKEIIEKYTEYIGGIIVTPKTQQKSKKTKIT